VHTTLDTVYKLRIKKEEHKKLERELDMEESAALRLSDRHVHHALAVEQAR
jgi:hypothetical protein